MLPSRLFRNTGIPPALRSLVTPHPSLPSTVAVQLRFRLGVIPESIPNTQRALESNVSSSSASTEPPSVPTTSSQALPEKMEPRLQLTFTCTVSGCGERSTHQFSKHAYEKGIVLVQCPGCKNRHLIADHLGWFKEGTEEGRLPRVEDMLRAKGEKVQRGIVAEHGDIEYAE
ncbi:DNL zinc finger-domain-containing protein [Flammula alnicola]|nr:DNL zinc finger-domain-containing protein [Flammula alnicola]